MENHILKSREVKTLLRQIKEQWGSEFDKSFVFIQRKDKLYITKREVFDIDIKSYSVGIYFGSFSKSGLRLSIEGSQLVGADAKKNIVDIDEDLAKKWMKGEDIKVNKQDADGHVLVRFGKDFLGCGLYKDDYVLNYVPKPRRINMI